MCFLPHISLSCFSCFFFFPPPLISTSIYYSPSFSHSPPINSFPDFFFWNSISSYFSLEFLVLIILLLHAFLFIHIFYSCATRGQGFLRWGNSFQERYIYIGSGVRRTTSYQRPGWTRTNSPIYTHTHVRGKSGYVITDKLSRRRFTSEPCSRHCHHN